MKLLATLVLALATPLALPPTANAQPFGAAESSKPKVIPPPADAPFLDFSNAWPARWGHDTTKGVQGVIRVLDIPAAKLGERAVWEGVLTPNAEDQADAAALLADSGATPGWETSGAFLVGTPRVEGQGGAIGGKLPGFEGGTVGGSLVFRFISGEASPGGAVDLQRTTFVYYDPAPAPDPKPDASAHEEAAPAQETPGTPAAPSASIKPRGVILVMPGLFGTPGPVIEGVVARLRQSGFAILRMMSQPSRFTQQVTFEIDATDQDRIKASAAAIARVLSDRAAECAYSAQAAWDFLESRRPELKGLPCGVLGMSGGAMTLPTVVAREPDRYRACMMIAGGADFWLINEHSNYADWIGALKVDWTPADHTEQQRIDLDLAYLAEAPLDSYHTAAALKGKHVVLMHATHDRAVPAPLGDVLWKRLGKPERWAGPWSHESIFMALAMQNDQVAEWFEKAMSDARQENAATAK